jgi:predicted DCC family thiol-disulfide oxidoreductase YuxK
VKVDSSGSKLSKSYPKPALAVKNSQCWLVLFPNRLVEYVQFHLQCTLNLAMDKEIVVIYDGQCQFCQASIDWIEQKLVVDAKAFQNVDLASYGFTFDQCSMSVHVVADGTVFVGAAAIAFLMKKRGNPVLSLLITTSGVLGRWGYRWVSTHRNSFLVRLVHHLLNQSNSRYDRKQKS